MGEAGAFYAFTAILGIGERRRAASASRRAARARGRIDRVRQQRSKQQQIRQARIARAQIASQAEAQGAEGSSAVAGAQAGVQGQLASNISFLDQLQTLGDFVSANQSQAASASGRAAVFQTASNIAGQYTTFGGSSKPPITESTPTFTRGS